MMILIVYYSHTIPCFIIVKPNRTTRESNNTTLCGCQSLLSHHSRSERGGDLAVNGQVTDNAARRGESKQCYNLKDTFDRCIVHPWKGLDTRHYASPLGPMKDSQHFIINLLLAEWIVG